MEPKIVDAKLLTMRLSIMAHNITPNKEKFEIFGRRVINGQVSPYLQNWLVDSYQER